MWRPVRGRDGGLGRTQQLPLACLNPSTPSVTCRLARLPTPAVAAAAVPSAWPKPALPSAAALAAAQPATLPTVSVMLCAAASCTSPGLLRSCKLLQAGAAPPVNLSRFCCRRPADRCACLVGCATAASVSSERRLDALLPQNNAKPPPAAARAGRRPHQRMAPTKTPRCVPRAGAFISSLGMYACPDWSRVVCTTSGWSSGVARWCVRVLPCPLVATSLCLRPARPVRPKHRGSTTCRNDSSSCSPSYLACALPSPVQGKREGNYNRLASDSCSVCGSAGVSASTA